MKKLSDSVVCVIDHGIFHHAARRLARDCKKVLYWTPWERAFPMIREANIGAGFPDVIRIADFWPIKSHVDFWFFPDVGFSGLQAELKSQGCKVFGCGEGDELEVYRGKFLDTLKKVGLQVPPHTAVKGMSKLREFLSDKTDKWIKVSKWRGDWETVHWRDSQQDDQTLAFRQNQIGPACEDIVYYVFDPIDTDIEDGMDAYFVAGEFPKRVIHGVEAKDKAYLGTFCDFNELPGPVLESSTKIAPALKSLGYNGFFSCEIRIKALDDFYFTDPTCRCGSPPSQVMVEMLANFSEIVQAGANGVCIEPVESAEFGVQLLVKLKRNPAQWGTAVIPKELDQWFKPLPCMIAESGVMCWPPDEENVAGWLVAIGDTIDGAVETLKGYVKLLPGGLESDISPIADLLSEVKQAESQDMPFTEQPIPEPSSVVD